MRIAVNTRFLLPGKLEGIGWFTHEVVRRMVARHPEVEFLFLFDRPYDPAFVYGPNVRPIVAPPPARHPLLWYWWFEWTIPFVLKKYGADLFFSPDGYCSLRSSCPTLMVIHDIAYAHFPEQVPGWVGRYYRHFAPRQLRRADRIIAVSEATHRDVVHTYGIDPGKIEVACNGARDTFRPFTEEEKQATRAQFSGGKPYLLYVGAIHPRKNVHRLITAFDQFLEKTGADCQLLLAGRMAWHTGPVQEAFEGAKNKKAIQFLGYQGPEDLARLTASAFASVYVSLFEGFGIPVLEAMQCDVPVITSNCSSMPEVAGKAGLLVDPYSVSAIADALQQMWENPLLRSNLVARGRLQREKFTWDRAEQVVWNGLEHLR